MNFNKYQYSIYNLILQNEPETKKHIEFYKYTTKRDEETH